ncbi:spoIIIJ-associated protein [Desulfocicer vacuolatum DSM 3385]|uniref:RNA-binding protein KhpB n=1 Tax=Desulfocicer vacuolatum DSM 3385 TaxID=1121400 RepID=A0A1W1ZSC9_9BACT|nr:RNA-binding cell elongation regulator Jag/EloR [Desulfocicer vacuolatum]SMC51379.1 spoIIIJ-associated protein [Desulfocicer vacuolatum DSM 3385]
MKQTQEFDGKNIDAAVAKACSELNVTKKQLVYDIISSGSSGIFGIVGVKKARIRVTLPEKKNTVDDQVSSHEEDSADPQGVMSIVDEAFGKEIPEPEVPLAGKKFKSVPAAKKKPPRKTAPRQKNKPKATESEKKPEKDLKKESVPQEAPVEKPRETSGVPVPEKTQKSREPSRPPEKSRKKKFKKKEVTTPPRKKEKTEPVDDRDEGFPPKYVDEIAVDVPEEAMELGRQTLQKMVDLITSDATVVAQSDEDRLLLKVEGGNSGVLIGRRGQTLEAMQFLTDKIINRYSESRVRLKVDIEGYMETRKDNLRALAHKMADKAQKTGKPATINQMTAQDRRIVHLALKDDARVRTQSMGDGYYRRLVIFPKKRAYKKRRNTQK